MAEVAEAGAEEGCVDVQAAPEGGAAADAEAAAAAAGGGEGGAEPMQT